MENSQADHQKFKFKITILPSNSTPRIHPRWMKNMPIQILVHEYLYRISMIVESDGNPKGINWWRDKEHAISI
jgi:hypothetical protein